MHGCALGMLQAAWKIYKFACSFVMLLAFHAHHKISRMRLVFLNISMKSSNDVTESTLKITVFCARYFCFAEHFAEKLDDFAQVALASSKSKLFTIRMILKRSTFWLFFVPPITKCFGKTYDEYQEKRKFLYLRL